MLRKAKQDPQAFKPLYERYYKPVFLFVFRRVGDREVAQDLTQQTFLKALVALPKYEFRGVPILPWFYRIALNEANSYFRRSRKAINIELDESMLHNLYEDLVYDSTPDELQARLPELLQTLTEEELQLIELRFFEKLQFYQIGQILNITENYAKVRTYRILDKLKKRFLNP